MRPSTTRLAQENKQGLMIDLVKQMTVLASELSVLSQRLTDEANEIHSLFVLTCSDDKMRVSKKKLRELKRKHPTILGPPGQMRVCNQSEEDYRRGRRGKA